MNLTRPHAKSSNFFIGAGGALIVSAFAFSNLGLILHTFDVPDIYHKDFLNNYVIGRAALLGIQPYQNISDLGYRFVGPGIGTVFPHPSPYPPPSMLLFAPFSLLPYPRAAIAWHLTQFVCLILVLRLVAKYCGVKKPILTALLLCPLMFAWNAVAEDFIWGNSMLVLLLPLTLSWGSLRGQRSISGGIFLGVVVALKILAWPLILFLLFKRKWRSVVAALATVLTLNLFAGFIIGLDTALKYYVEVPPTVTPLYRERMDSFSLYSVAWRFFDGTQSPLFDTQKAEPLFYAPSLALILSFALPAIAIVVTILLAHRSKSFDIAFALMICTSVILGPLAWLAYLTWLVIPLSVVLKRITLAGDRRAPFATGIAALLLFFFPTPLIRISRLFIVSGQSSAPFLSSFLTFIPLVAISLLGFLLIKMNLSGFSFTE